MLSVLIASVFLASSPPGLQRELGECRLFALVDKGAYTGIAVQIKEKGRWCEAAKVLFGPAGRWRAAQGRHYGSGTRKGLEFRQFDTSETASTPKLGAGSYVRISLAPGEQFPRLDFRLELEALDPASWQAALHQRAPLYFLVLPMPRARVWHLHGLLCPTPRWDPYPLNRPSIASRWAEGWSFGAALDSLTIPAMSLWDDQAGKLVGYEWAEARLTDKASKHLGIAYCAGTPNFKEQFLALLSNYQRRWHELTYPQVPKVIQSHLRVIYSLHLPSTADPNQLVLKHIYQAYRSLLPPVAVTNDLSWMVPRQLEELGNYKASGDIFYTVKKDSWGWNELFFDPGTIIYGGSFRATDQLYKQGQPEAIATFEKQLVEFTKHVQWETIAGDRCCFWWYPLSGSWKKEMGGESANTIHNVQQFGIGAAMLACYVNTHRQDLLPYIDGLFNWARHYVFTRGDIADIPESMFTIQTSLLACEFLMNYHFTFAGAADEKHRQRAQEALSLAYMVVCRNDNLTVGDPDETDTLDPSFMAPGNYNSFWLGQISNAELCEVVKSLLLMYVETGEPLFKWQVRGALERWWMGFKEDCWHTAENIDWFGESTGIKGHQTGVHGPADSFWEWAQPIGDTIIHVTCGKSAAIAFCKGTRVLDVSDYVYLKPNNFRLRIICLGDDSIPAEPFNIIISMPWRTLRSQPVKINKKTVSNDRLRVLGTYGEHLYLQGVCIGDIIEIGDVGKAKPIKFLDVPTAGAKPLNRDKRAVVSLGGYDFILQDLSSIANCGPRRDWLSPDHYGGLPVGLTYAYGIPYWVIPPGVNCGKWALGAGAYMPLRGPEAFIFAFVDKPEALRVIIGEEELRLNPEEGLLVAEGWPLCKWKLYLFPVKLSSGRSEMQVKEGALVAAITTTTMPTGVVEKLLAQVRQQKALPEERKTAEPIITEAKCRLAEAGRAEQVPIAFIPPLGRTYRQISDTAVKLDLQPIALLPEELVDPALFNPRRFPVAIYTGDEQYLRTVKKSGDGEEALLRYLRQGGFLLVAGACRPFTYAVDIQPDGTPKVITEPWLLFGKNFQLFLLGPGEATSDAIGFEQPPEGIQLTMYPMSKQPVFWEFPSEITFPSRGDLRYRPLTCNGMPPEDEVVPLITTRGSDSKNYGPAAALIRHHCQDFHPAQVLWVWGTLLEPPFNLYEQIIPQILTYLATHCQPAREALPEAFRRHLPESRLRIAVLPPDTWGRNELIEGACADVGARPLFLTPDQFVDPGFFNAKNFPIAVQAVGGERFIFSYRATGDGEAAYKRYLEQGGTLIVCQNATPFWYEMLWGKGEWQTRAPQRFWSMAYELGFETHYGFEEPQEPMWLELTEAGRHLWPDLPARLPLDYLRDRRWRWLIPYRSSAARHFIALAYATRPDGKRYEGLAAAMIEFLESQHAGARVIYLWGNMVDGEVGEKLLRGCLQYIIAKPVINFRHRLQP